jgi:cyclomaltodextrinase
MNTNQTRSEGVGAGVVGVPTTPAWVDHALWWHLYPLGFLAAEATSAAGRATMHRLSSLERWLDYAVELGASGLLLGPIFASSTHGYDTVDHLHVDPRLGSDDDFDHLVASVHARGLRILLDGVFNHVGRDHPRFRQALVSGAGSPHDRWFRIDWDSRPKPGGEPDYATFEGHRGLVALNHTEPEVADYVVEVMCRWLESGADGWRLDAAYAVPTDFWAAVIPRVRRSYPDAYFFGEVIHGDYAAFVEQSTLDAVTQYELWKAIWSSLSDRNFFELAWALDRHNSWLETFVPQTFVGNHDVTRLASRLSDPWLSEAAIVILLTVGGTPSLYYGDEQAYQGVKENRVGGDDAVRTPFPSEGPRGFAPFGWPTYHLHQELIGLRRRHPWLHRATTAIEQLTNRHIVYRSSYESNYIVIAINLDDHSAAHRGGPVSSVLAGTATLDDITDSAATIQLPPRSWAVLT